jgi:hypothetical protein
MLLCIRNEWVFILVYQFRPVDTLLWLPLLELSLKKLLEVILSSKYVSFSVFLILSFIKNTNLDSSRCMCLYWALKSSIFKKCELSSVYEYFCFSRFSSSWWLRNFRFLYISTFDNFYSCKNCNSLAFCFCLILCYLSRSWRLNSKSSRRALFSYSRSICFIFLKLSKDSFFYRNLWPSLDFCSSSSMDFSWSKSSCLFVK